MKKFMFLFLFSFNIIFADCTIVFNSNGYEKYGNCGEVMEIEEKNVKKTNNGWIISPPKGDIWDVLPGGVSSLVRIFPYIECSEIVIIGIDKSSKYLSDGISIKIRYTLTIFNYTQLNIVCYGTGFSYSGDCQVNKELKPKDTYNISLGKDYLVEDLQIYGFGYDEYVLKKIIFK
jgi:hypothetical protein